MKSQEKSTTYPLANSMLFLVVWNPAHPVSPVDPGSATDNGTFGPYARATRSSKHIDFTGVIGAKGSRGLAQVT